MITIFSGGPGLHHNFFRFTLDYLSRPTPDIDIDYIFDHSGACHNIDKTKLLKKFDVVQGLDTVDKSIRSCITVRADDLLYYQRVGLARESSKNIDLYNLNNFNNWQEWNKHWVNQIYKFYDIAKEEKLPKFIIRDSIKKGYLDYENMGLYKSNQNIVQQVKNLKNSYILPVTSFFSLDTYRYQLEKINVMYNLNLYFNNLPNLYRKFYETNYILQTHNVVFDILDSVKKSKSMTIPALDVFQEGYIYATLEKTNNFIIMPLIDNFFSSTEQIINYIKYYPKHYKAMNPNLPTFNNIPNPFFLHRQKTK